jgi:O-antigen ligase
MFPHLILAAVAWGALAFGAVYPWAYLPLAAGCAALGIRGVLTTGTNGDTWRPDVLTIALAAVAVGIALQTIPLPYDLFARLSPGGDRYLRTQFLAFTPPPSSTLSLSPEETTNALLLFSSLVVLFTGLMHVMGRQRAGWLASRLLGFGVLLAVIAVVQAAALDRQDPRVYGFWRPQQITLPFGPFVNRNHFAGWMVMALPVGIGYSLAVFQTSDRPRRGDWRTWLLWFTRAEANRFALVAFCLLAMCASVVLSTSRSGMASLGVAVAVFGVIAFLRGGREVKRLAALYLVTLVAGAVLWAGFGSTVGRFAQSGAHLPARLDAWRDTMRIVTDFPLAGVGIGAFPRAMLVYQSFDRRYLYHQAHNDYLEVLAEGGLVVAIPVAVAALLLLWRVARRLLADEDGPERMWVRAGAAAGLAGIAAQSLVEFSLQMPGNAVLFTVIAAIAAHDPPRAARRDPAASSSRRTPVERNHHD